MTKTLTEPLSIDLERELVAKVKEMKAELRLCDLGNAGNGTRATAIRADVDAFQATIAASAEARRAEDTARRRQEAEWKTERETRDREHEEAREQAVAFLEERLSRGPVRRSDLFDAAEAAGIGREAMIDAARELGLHEIDGAYLTGTAGPDVGAPFWTLAPRVGITKPAA
jgi:hypothetical protein